MTDLEFMGREFETFFLMCVLDEYDGFRELIKDLHFAKLNKNEKKSTRLISEIESVYRDLRGLLFNHMLIRRGLD